MSGVIRSNSDLCAGCNRCVRECPMEIANITYQDEAGNIKVRVDDEKCISCGRCVLACKHKARYYIDDTERFFSDLAAGVNISVVAAPSIRTNIPEYKQLFTYLKQLGVSKIFDVSLGADICIWMHLNYLKNNTTPMITQPCPVVVTYCEKYRHDLLEQLSPIHSPVACAAIYLREYQGLKDRIAMLSPCIAKANEFENTGLAQYNVTFTKLLEYIEENKIIFPSGGTEFDHIEGGLGSLFPMPGGLKENIEYFTGNKYHIVKAEGYSLYEKLNKYAETPSDTLPEVFDVLNCIEGCNIGPATNVDRNPFAIAKIMNKRKKLVSKDLGREYQEALYKTFDETLNQAHFLREYTPIVSAFPQINEEDIEKAFLLLGKTDYDKQNVDCGACGSETCQQMARKIALNVSIPINCIVKTMDDARTEHNYNTIAREQLLALEKMHEADERMKIILDSNPHITILFDSSFKAVDCNPAALEFMGFATKEEMTAGFTERLVSSLPAYQLDGRASVPISERLITAARKGYIKFDTILYLQGEERRISVEFRRIPFENNFAIVAYIFDMTNMHNHEKELTTAHELNKLQLAKLNLVVKASKIGLWEMEVVKNDPLNPANVFLWSDELRQMLGFSDELDFPNVLNSWSSRLHPDDRDRVIVAFINHLRDISGRTTFDIECRLMKKNDEYAFYHVTGETVRDENGEGVRSAGALVDITEAKNILLDAEKRRIDAQAANEAKSTFLSTMSHEIRTPMNAILGITEIQMQNRSLAPEVKDALDRIYQSGDLLLGIINDILDLSKIEAGKLELYTDRYEIASLLSDTSQLNIMRIGSKPIEFELNLNEDLPSVLFGDEMRVKQILNNILSNAFKYTSEGTVDMTVYHEPAAMDDEITLVFVIKDTGHGMTKEQVEKLFDEYSRFNEGANRSTEGTGLGMSITQNLIRMMNGSIRIDSEPGKGTEVTIYLPQGRIGDQALGKELADNLRLFRETGGTRMKRVQITREPMPYGSVLIVDDVETNIYVAKGLLTPYELKIDSADSGFNAIAKIKKGSVYDIVFMDHMMPEMDGVEATKIMREMGYNHPIVALTANAVAGQADMFLQNGFDDYISKPIDVRQLNAVLNKLIRDKQPPEVLAGLRAAPEMKNVKDEPELDIKPLFAEVFLRDAAKTVALLDAIVAKNGDYNEEDVRNYVVQVHGIKGALANIGKMDLSAVALKLEHSGRDGNTAVIASETPAFLSLLRDFMEVLKPRAEQNDVADTAENKAYLSEKLLEIQTACEEYDEDTADAVLTVLKKKTWSRQVKELLEKISEHLLHSDFEDAVDAINKFLEA